MLNFRKLKHDFSPAILKEGKALYDKQMVLSTKIVHLKRDSIRFACRVQGSFDHCYASELEIDRHESVIIDSDCDCSYKYDCQHLAAVLFYLECHYDELLLSYSKETNLIHTVQQADEAERCSLLAEVQEAELKEHVRQDRKFQKELLQEYLDASRILGQSSFFLPENEMSQDRAELALVFAIAPCPRGEGMAQIEVQLALRLPFRSKPLLISHLKSFLDAIRYHEPLYIGSRRYFFSLNSFHESSAHILRTVLDTARLSEGKGDKHQRTALLDTETFGTLLATSYALALSSSHPQATVVREEHEGGCIPLPYIHCGSIEEPLRLSKTPAIIRFELSCLDVPTPKIFLSPQIAIPPAIVAPEETVLLECAQPGMIFQNVYYPFRPNIKRQHLRNLADIRKMTIPEPLFGTFLENSLPELHRFAEVIHHDMIERFVTLPFVHQLQAECDIQYLNGELEAALYFVYGDVKIPAAPSQLNVDHIHTFITADGILARNLAEEQKIIHDLFQDFSYDPIQGLYSAKNEKKIVEFMTEIIPLHQHHVRFHCPENLLDQFIYDRSVFKLSLRESPRVDLYEVEIEVDGHLSGVTVDLLWDCLASKRPFLELSVKKQGQGKRRSKEHSTSVKKILILDLEVLAPVVQVLDDMGINQLDPHVESRPLWTLASLDAEQFSDLPIQFSMTSRLQEIQRQMLGHVPHHSPPIPSQIRASLRNYQVEGVSWLDRLRCMYLNGILADDMGLGKTLQAITALTRYHVDHASQKSLVVCPTSLVHNWKEEVNKFNPEFNVLAVDGNPYHRKKLLSEVDGYDLIITSYTLLQKDIEFYKTIPFGYAILDEAQHIKNRGTRNAQSVKMIQAAHRLILTGTPIENSLDELWSLFDFLMPGLLSSYDRFVEKYIRHASAASQPSKTLEHLKRKVAPFILRRMKKDVLTDLPPVSEIVYHCHLSDVQQNLYRSYAASAREELSQLVRKEGFDRVQIHVLATLTRLKQICCHPAIFAKEKAESGDSSKYDLLLELLHTLIEAGHKTVIFSQYTRMLTIMREDLHSRGIRFEYLDGSSKNRLSIVKKFNEDHNIPVFLVSLKAGGSGLNLVGADTVIHYDMWWNPAVENQATDRVHRLGQTQSVSSYKLITLNTIEEKIVDLHRRKRGLVKEVVSQEEDMMARLTWEEVLELLQT